MTKEERIKLEKDFLEKNPEIILESWDDSHVHISKIINEKSYLIGAEIGVAFGSHSDSILKNTEVEKLYGIDPYQNYIEYHGDSMNLEQTKFDNLFKFVKERLSIYGERFDLVRDYSHLCHEKFEDESLDFVYIDGNHFEEYIKRDLEIWWKKVKSGGILSGHDYNHTSFPHVTLGVNSFFSNLGYSVDYLGNHVWCVYK